MSLPLYYVILIILGFLPSIIWLAYFLRKDCHPEPKHLIIKTFLMGIIVSPLVVQAGYLSIYLISTFFGAQASTSEILQDYRFLLWAAFLEEMIKFLAVTFVVLKSVEFDEPVDAMIYMVTAGLGFAAMENMLYLSRTIQEGIINHATLGMHLQATLTVWLLRFTGATLLHSLSSALLGYFLAMSWFYFHHQRKLIAIGIVLATIFHFVFNVIVSTPHVVSQLYSIILLIAMAFLISILFDKIKERHQSRLNTA